MVDEAYWMNYSTLCLWQWLQHKQPDIWHGHGKTTFSFQYLRVALETWLIKIS